MVKKRVKVIAGVLLILLGLLALLFWLWNGTRTSLTDVEKRVAEAVASAVAVPTEPVTASADPDVTEKPEESEGPAPYVSPVDFAALQAENEDIYAWLCIPGTEVNYPLLQSENGSEYYLNHNSKKERDRRGALFTQSEYNNKEFTDPVTIIYGHDKSTDGPFGTLQTIYSEEGGIEDYRDIYIYLPDEEQHYAAFAAVPFPNYHILYYYDFSDAEMYQEFLDKIYSTRAIGANVDEEFQATPEDQVVILSTCLYGNSKRRYLVLAKRIDDRTTTDEVLVGAG